MKSYVNNSNSKINTSKENIKRRKSNEWNMREITTMNRERIQKKKKDKITWQVIIHSTFFFFDCSFLFHFLDDYFQLIQFEISFWYSSCSLFDYIFSRCIVNDNKERKGTQDQERNDETFWSVEMMKQNEMIEEGRQIQKRKKEMKFEKQQKKTNHKGKNITWQVIRITPPFCDSFLCFIWFHTCQINSFWVFLSLSLLYLSFSS